MCGFAGVVAWDDRYCVSRETLGRMSASIAHRGPDGEGYHINHEAEGTRDRPQVALAFRRLAILDPDPRSNQPFTDGRHWLVFNGEIYNFRELRAELAAADPSYQWRTSGDTEVLLRAYALWGHQCITRLDGMYAFAAWDERAGTLYLTRDRTGQKPLYCASPVGGGAIAFASELGALRQLPWFDGAIPAAQLARYLRWGYVPHIQTIYRGAAALSPACALIVSPGQDTITAADISPGPIIPAAKPLADAVRQTRRLVEAAVARQLVSDVPLGCFLSGGTDSSVIALCMRQALGAGTAMHTFSIGFDDPRYDESAYAAAVARHIGSEHHAFTVRPDAAADLPKLAAAFGEPFADSSALPTYYLARETRRHVTVALSGDGGDELFGGYDRYRAMRLGCHLARTPSALRKLVAAPVLLAARGTHPKSTGSRLRRLLCTLDLPAPQRYASYVRLFDEALIEQLLLEPPVGEADRAPEVPQVYAEMLDGRDEVEAALATDRLTYLPDDLHAKVDRASMRHALEVRAPFMDRALLSFTSGLTTDELLKGGPKRMLREAFAAELPGFVFKRRKMGFAVPIGQWFRGELRPMLRDHLFASDSFARQHFNTAVVQRLVDEHEESRVDHSQRLYALLMLELWWRIQKG